ncbi:hypothetical protein [Blastococcus sp. TF02A-30]|uniref:hypothetical protein n=1 Tax=Blastococcus sp. TF02A-30 TaxID=2250580 RepID=UPI000DE96741|nr:hypothetical protein [Blastococcus sp. TF02A-30]RBY89519.1 hypothetical protein DQ241_08710 [Blastococcus sp. TF02A-30]
MAEDLCARGDHVAPAEGGSCPCGMVTRVPAARPAPSEDDALRELVARSLGEGGDGDDPDLRRQADRVLDALTEAGLLLAPPAGEEQPA